MNIERFHELEPYGLGKNEKEKLFFDEMLALTEYHASKCNEYNSILCKLDITISSIKNIERIPYIPVRLFKMFDLKSITDEEIFKMIEPLIDMK